MVINWSGLDDQEKLDLIPTLSTTDNWILLTQPLGDSNKTQPPFREATKTVYMRAGGGRGKMN